MVNYKKVTCIAATINKDSGDAFSEINLEQLDRDIHKKTIPITDNFNHECIIGQVIDSYITHSKLYITCKIINTIPPCYIVPGFKVINAEYIKETDVFIYTEVELVRMGTSVYPEDNTVTIFEEVDNA